MRPEQATFRRRPAALLPGFQRPRGVREAAQRNLTLTINRGCVKTQTINGNTVNLVGTCVTILYPYKWQYSSVTGLLGITFIGPTGITTTASAFNEN